MITNESVQKKLLKRLEEVQAELRRREFVLYGEMELLEIQIAAAKRGSHTLFAGVGRPHAALMLCLNLRDHAMTVDEIVDMLVNGGFPMKMVSARGTINDLLNYHAGCKNIQPAKITLRRVEDRFGMAEWHDDKFLHIQHKVLDVTHVGL